ncbi:MAG: site-specific DNA-methyltransferase [Akkermansia muciniphila]
MLYDRLSPESPIDTNIDRLAKVFPSVVREGKVDFDALRQLLGDDIGEPHELYGLNWKGKAQARRAALTPSLGTLRPCPEESVDWNSTKNLYIEGDNLEVLKLLRKSYSGKVKMIYIDPPYNTGNDFVYEDDYQCGIDQYKKLTEQEETLPSNVESNGRFHTLWLNMMYPRLVIAHELLSDDGVMFVSLDDGEVSNFRLIADEIFGPSSFVTTLHCQMSTTQGMKVKAAQKGNIVKNAEYVLCYTKNGRKDIASKLLYDLRPEYDEHYQLIMKDDGSIGSISELYDYSFPKDLANKKPLSLSEAFRKSDEFAKIVKANLSKIVRMHSVTCSVPDNIVAFRHWEEMSIDHRNYILTTDKNGNLQQLLRLSDSWGLTDGYYRTEGLRKIRGDWWEGFYIDMGNVSKEGGVSFKNGKKPVRLIQQLAYMTTNEGDIVLDFFSGSATTAHSVMKNNLECGIKSRHIMVQLPEPCDRKSEAYKAGYKNICEIGKERIRRAGKKLKEEAGLIGQGIDTGFRVYKLDSSNVKPWNPDAEDLGASLDLFSEHLVEGRTSDDLLTEVMLKSGIDLCEETETREIAGHRVYSLGYGQFYACMDRDLSGAEGELALGIAAWHAEECAAVGGEQQDTCTVFVADEAFAGRDDAKMNFVSTLQQYGICNVKAL